MILNGKDEITTKIKFEGKDKEIFTIKYIGNLESQSKKDDLRNLEDFATKIIVGWEGILDPDKKPLKCTSENIKKFVLTEYGLKRFYHMLSMATTNITEFVGVSESLKDLKLMHVGRLNTKP